MKKTLLLALLLSLFLCSCTPTGSQGGTADAAAPSNNSTVLEPYDDVRGIGETVVLSAGEYTPKDIITYAFNQNTTFEGCEARAENILENGKDPGLQISELHAQGITGENVTVAIIDQPLLQDHPEYVGKIVRYHTVGLSEKDNPSSMHGPAVVSLLAGNTIGSAPGVKLYYVALKFWERNAPEMGAEALDWLIEQNQSLPAGKKIRAISVSADFTNAEYFDDPGIWDEAVKRAEDAGILVLDCRRDCDTCVFWPSYFDPEDRDDIARSSIGTPDGDFLNCPSQALGTPVGYRTVAEVYSEGEYAYSYDAAGGHSWAVPYGTGVLALGWQIDPTLSGKELIDRMRATAYKNEAGESFLDPAAFIESVRSIG